MKLSWFVQFEIRTLLEKQKKMVSIEDESRKMYCGQKEQKNVGSFQET